MALDRLFEFTFTQSSSVNSGIGDWNFVDADAFATARRYRPKKLVLDISPDPTGTGRIEFTVDDRSRIEAGTANVIEWYPGDVSVNKCIVVKNLIAAFRLVAVSGNMRAIVRGD